MPFCIVSLLAYCVIKSVIVMLFCGEWDLLDHTEKCHTARLLSRKVAVEIVRNFAISDVVALQ